MKDSGAVESFYIGTQDGLFFAVKGMEHPPDRWMAVLRYVPDPENGSRLKDGVRYRRLYRFSEQETWIRERNPRYLAYDPVFQSTMQSVPRSSVRRVFNPVLKFQGLLSASGRDSLEDDAVSFLSLLQKESAAPVSAFGITGSLLIGMHTENSDMDVAVFGETNCLQVYITLRKLLDRNEKKVIRRLDSKGMEDLYRQRAADTEMNFSDFARMERGKVNQGEFGGRTWFVRFIRDAGATEPAYGMQRYKTLGRKKIRASVSDARDAIFTPCRYGLSGVEEIGESRVPVPEEIVSFRGRFCEQALVGDSVEAEGTLERVECRDGGIRHRLLLGNSRYDTMVVIR